MKITKHEYTLIAKALISANADSIDLFAFDECKELSDSNIRNIESELKNQIKKLRKSIEKEIGTINYSSTKNIIDGILFE